jgi:hypothetical protein
MAWIARISAASVLTLGAVTHVAAQQHPSMPAGMTHEQHMAEMKRAGDVAMGFDQDKATHHFTLTRDGGLISVSADDPADTTTLEEIRTHLAEIAQAFAAGDFGKPTMTHGELPSGAADMQRLATHIQYGYEQTDQGGLVRIATQDPEALSAVHEFLRYQIREHETGDPLDVPR